MLKGIARSCSIQGVPREACLLDLPFMHVMQMSWVGGDAAPDKPLPNSHNQLRAFNDSRRAWRVAIAALEFFALVPCIEAEGDATSALSGHSTAQALIVQPMTNSSPISHTSGIAIDPGFSEEALAELRTSFDTFDEDRSGAISSEELLDRFLELGATEAEASAVLARVDSHHTGDISFDEFVAVVGPMMRERGRIALQRAFEQLDRDHSGSIDRYTDRVNTLTMWTERRWDASI